MKCEQCGHDTTSVDVEFVHYDDMASTDAIVEITWSCVNCGHEQVQETDMVVYTIVVQTMVDS